MGKTNISTRMSKQSPVEETLKFHKLAANLLAWHAEFPSKKELEQEVQERKIDPGDPRSNISDLKFDSNGIWSIGPIGRITVQGPARHALAASIWPMSTETGATSCGFLSGAYKRVQPTPSSLGMTTGRDERDSGVVWPSITLRFKESCEKFRARMLKSPPSGKVIKADSDLTKKVSDFKRNLPTIDQSPLCPKEDFADVRWPKIARSAEFLSDWQKADPHGNQWRKGGHFPPQNPAVLRKHGA